MVSQSQLTLEIDRLRVEFASQEAEQDFQAYQLDHGHACLHTTLIFCSFFYLAFALTDVAALGYTRDVLMLFLARALVAVTALAGLCLIRLRPKSLLAPRLAATAAEVVGMAAFMLIVWHRPHEMPWHAMSMCIMLIVVYIFIPNRLIVAQAIAFASTAIFIVIAVKLAHLKASDVLTMSMLLLLANSFGAVAARRYHRLWREEYRVQLTLKQLSIRDHLTGCFNRRHLYDHLLSSEFSRARRSGHCLSVIACDIDHFKAINDTYGHQMGDAVLRDIAAILQEETREHVDSVVRHGGEEFILVLPQTALDGAVQVAERLRCAIAGKATIVGASQRIVATASFGVVAVNFSTAMEGATGQTLIAAADALLYAAKKAGRDNIQSSELHACPSSREGVPPIHSAAATGDAVRLATCIQA
jgi:diguanylate cyclase (GGDEF)-like protein